jgi:Glycosyl hydrolase catalytic core
MATEDSMWGMVIHYPDENLIDILKRGNVGWLRTGVRFSEQTAPGQIPVGWGDVMRKVREAARPLAQQVYFGIDPTYPKWIADGVPILHPASADWNKRLEHWGNFVRQVITTFAPLGVTHFNIGNEPNDPQFFPYIASEYFNLLLTAAQIIRSAGYKLYAPDIATGDEHNPWDFLRSCLQFLNAHGQSLDAVTIHGYCSKDGGVPGLMAQLQQVRSVLHDAGVSAPVWLTETGVSNLHFPNDPEKNAARVKELCQWIGDGPAPSTGVLRLLIKDKFLKKVFFFVWSDDLGESGKYAWLRRPSPGALLEPIPQLWDAYKSVTGGS